MPRPPRDLRRKLRDGVGSSSSITVQGSSLNHTGRLTDSRSPAMRLDSRVIEIAADPDPTRRIERLLQAARELLQADAVSLLTGARCEPGPPRAGTGSRLGVPIQDGDGVTHLLLAEAARPAAFTEEHEQALAIIAALVGG